MANQGVQWTKEEARRNLPPVSSFTMRQMGIKQNQITYANDIDDIEEITGAAYDDTSAGNDGGK